MVQMYGERWTRNYGEEPLQMWAIALAPYGAKQFRAMLQACHKRPNPWQVPTLPEIVQYCEEARPKAFTALPLIPQTPEQRERNRQRIRELSQQLKGQAA